MCICERKKKIWNFHDLTNFLSSMIHLFSNDIFCHLLTLLGCWKAEAGSSPAYDHQLSCCGWGARISRLPLILCLCSTRFPRPAHTVLIFPALDANFLFYFLFFFLLQHTLDNSISALPSIKSLILVQLTRNNRLFQSMSGTLPNLLRWEFQSACTCTTLKLY